MCGCVSYFLTFSVRRLLLCVTSRYSWFCMLCSHCHLLVSCFRFINFCFITVWFALSDRLLVLLYILLVLYGGDAEDRSGEAVHITMMLQVIEQEEVQQVQIVALLGRVVLPIDRRRR